MENAEKVDKRRDGKAILYGVDRDGLASKSYMWKRIIVRSHVVPYDLTRLRDKSRLETRLKTRKLNFTIKYDLSIYLSSFTS